MFLIDMSLIKKPVPTDVTAESMTFLDSGGEDSKVSNKTFCFLQTQALPSSQGNWVNYESTYGWCNLPAGRSPRFCQSRGFNCMLLLYETGL